MRTPDEAGLKVGPPTGPTTNGLWTRRLITTALLMMGSCRTAGLEAPSEHRSPQSDPPLPPAAVAAPERRPADPMEWADVPLPYPPEAIVVRRVPDISPVVLFADEAAALRRRVADQLVALGYEVVPIEDLEQIESSAAQGRLPLEGDLQCQVPLTPSEVGARYFTSYPQAHIDTTCTPGSDAKPGPSDCRLSVLVGRAGVVPRFVSPPIRDAHDPSAWARVSLQRNGESVPGGIIGGVEGGTDIGLRFDGISEVGPWKQSPREAIADALIRDRFRCVHPDPRVSAHWELSVAVDRTGTVERCAASSADLPARAQDGDCLCQQLETVSLGRGKPGRRLRAYVRDPGLSSMSWRRLEPVQPRTQAWIQRLGESPEARACLHSAHRVQTPWHGRAVLELSPSGEVQALEMFGEISTTETVDLAQCLVRAFESVALPCRPPGIETLHVAIELDPIGGVDR